MHDSATTRRSGLDARPVLSWRDAGTTVWLRAKPPPSRGGRLAALPLWPLDLATLWLDPLSPRWQAQPLGELAFDAAGIAIELARWPMSRRLFLPKGRIEMLSFRVGAEGGRRVGWRMCLQADGEITADFEVDEVDSHEEAMAVLFRIAHVLGCAEYRPLQESNQALAVELLLKAAPAGAGGVYRRSARVPDAREVPREVLRDLLPRKHARFEPPTGFAPPAVDEQGARAAGAHTWAPGKRVVFGHPPRRGRLLLLPLLPLAAPVLALLLMIILGMIGGLCLSLIVIAASIFGVDLSDWYDFAPLYYVLFTLAAIGATMWITHLGAGIWRAALRTHIIVDWTGSYVRIAQFFGRWQVPLSHVDGVVHSGGRLYLQLQERDVLLSRGGDGLAGLAVELARRLDVPVSLE